MRYMYVYDECKGYCKDSNFLTNFIFFTDYVAIGPRFSNLVLQALLVLLRKIPPVVVSSILTMQHNTVCCTHTTD